MDTRFGKAKKSCTGMTLSLILMSQSLPVRILIINTFPQTSSTIVFLLQP